MPLPRIDDPLTPEQLRSALDYDMKTGIFTWRYRPTAAKEWNTRYAGKQAGTVKKAYGYIQISVRGWLYLADRLAFLHVLGIWPGYEVDHIDNNPGNNAWDNLRPATSSENKMNTRLRSDNISGFKGVSWSKAMNMWAAEIWIDYRRHRLGYFSTKEEAHTAYCEAATKYFGEFARFA